MILGIHARAKRPATSTISMRTATSSGSNAPARSPEAQALKELVPGGPHVADAQKKSLARTAAAYLDGTLAARHPATLDILRNGFPRLTQVHAGARIQPASVSPEALYHIVSVLERSYLFVQGPPGSGKTYTGARVIARLLAAGKRVGVMAGGHKAIHNLLHELEKVAHDGRIPLHGLHKHSGTNRDSRYVSQLAAPLVASADDNVAAETGDYNVISGTGWLFAREGMVGRLDYLFIDEAGQTALAEAVAVSPCAANIVLLGDPMQLAQVTQGVHGEGAGASVLAHLLGDASTVPENRGVLLDTSYRMAPAICTFISNALRRPTAAGGMHGEQSHRLTGVLRQRTALRSRHACRQRTRIERGSRAHRR